MSDSFVIDAATVVTPEAVLPECSVRVEQGRIAELRPGGSFNGSDPHLDARGKHLFPGFIDLHCDAIEKQIEPRPNTFFPVDIAIHELDKKLAACGVTTIFHSLSFAELEVGLRSNGMAAKIVREVNRQAPTLRINTRVHTRFEVTDGGAVPILQELIRGGEVGLFSLMDHTPGQGQFREVASFKNYYGPVYAKTEEEMDRIIARKQQAQNGDALTRIGRLTDCCREHLVALASHDDDCAAKLDWLQQLGVGMSEFPVNLAAARAARDRGITVILGAPNVLRGSSQGGNLSAREALAEGCGEILCSDYAPQTLLHAVLTLDRLGLKPLHEAVNLVSRNPAQAVGIGAKTGALVEGLAADLQLLDLAQGFPRVLKTFVGGLEVYGSC
ncbi:alpha-D-ribose 1-methylphosphonate 5-triphosphate diphosphatase [Desulfuromonas carbonis]|uniref:alpha-D-ribose 1-methylphosphonate 5-triphosphate diphosphatase n=1 Tax=Desulfuromonas sp. DDH964 TaxID=1823759 RepID=UPI00078B1C47|nr:alpha-D-ribose 1-methylphosphonate 5-triphosphate diphosphatase [Desulfuromonas sp. DDH964]AMV73719.1 Alpha-D-ribose 1-methylphosphonate 5-triphosphate diphosphatase [Desulfuromonas sp. DDH964]